MRYQPTVPRWLASDWSVAFQAFGMRVGLQPSSAGSVGSPSASPWSVGSSRKYQVPSSMKRPMCPSWYSAPRLGSSRAGGLEPPWASASAATPARVSSATASAVTARGMGDSLEFADDRNPAKGRRPVQEVVIASAARTAVGSYGKSLKDVPTTELGATAATAAMERAGIEPEQVEHVVFGNVIHSAPEDMYMARVVGIKAGIPKETPAFTVNRLCGTGVQAIVSAAQTIQTGEADVASPAARSR